MDTLATEHADAVTYWKAYNTFPATAESWATMKAMDAKYGRTLPNPAKRKVIMVQLPPTHQKWQNDMVDGDSIKQELVYSFDIPEPEAHRLICQTNAVAEAISDHKEVNAEDIQEAKKDENLDDYWKDQANDLVELIYSAWNRKQPKGSAN
jgi:hypothetical protein